MKLAMKGHKLYISQILQYLKTETAKGKWQEELYISQILQYLKTS